MNLSQIANAIFLLGVFILIGKLIKLKVKILNDLFLPSSIIAGILALLLGEYVLGSFVDQGHWASEGIFPKSILRIWRDLPGMLINVVFACLILGKDIPSPKKIWQLAGPQGAFGQTMAWGQYVIGSLLVIFVLHPFFDVDHKAAALIEIGFQGGHGTAAGLKQTFDQLSYAEGTDLALGLATLGVVAGLILGTIFINLAIRSKKIHIARQDVKRGNDEISNIHHNEKKESLSESTQASEPLSSQLGLIGLAVFIGWSIFQGLLWIENHTWGLNDDLVIIKYMPLFPLAMIGGLILQLILNVLKIGDLANRTLINNVSGVALDLIIVSALATLSLEILGQHFWTLLILCLGGISWNVFAFWFLAPKALPQSWFERGIGDFGQSMGMTVTGLLLMRVSDPQDKSKAIESFSYKQLLFEPIVGGGVFTALSLPLIHNVGIYWFLFIVSLLFLAFLSLSLLYFGRNK